MGILTKLAEVLVDALGVKIENIQRTTIHIGFVAVVVLAGLFIFLGAIGLAIAALYLAMAPSIGPIAALFFCACIALGLATILVVSALCRR